MRFEMEEKPKKPKKKSHIVTAIPFKVEKFKKRNIHNIAADIERVLRLRTKQKRPIAAMMNLKNQGIIIVAGAAPEEPVGEGEKHPFAAILERLSQMGGGVIAMGGPERTVSPEDMEAAKTMTHLFDALPGTLNPNADKAKEEVKTAIEQVTRGQALTPEKINAVIRVCEYESENHSCGNPGCRVKDMARMTAEGLRAHLKLNLQ